MQSRLFCSAVATLALIITFGAGCAGTQVNENDPKALYESVEQDIEDGRYQNALDRLRMIKNKFPYSRYSVLATLRIADVYFLQESYIEAAGSYQIFSELHPKHERVAYALFRLAESYFRSIPGTVARDIESAQNALRAYENFAKRFPGDKNHQEALSQIKKCKNILADKELYIADFYMHWEPEESAYDRYRKIVSLYPDTKAGKKAKEMVAKLKRKFNEKDPSEVERVNGAVKYRVYE